MTAAGQDGVRSEPDPGRCWVPLTANKLNGIWSTSPRGNGKGCFPLVFSELPIHASNQWRRKISRIARWSPQNISLKKKGIVVRRLPGVFPERIGIRELALCHRRTSYVYRLKSHTKRLLIKRNGKCFSFTAFLKCTLFLVPVIYLQTALSNLISCAPLQKWKSFSRAPEKHFLTDLLMSVMSISMLSFIVFEKAGPVHSCWASKSLTPVWTPGEYF